MEGIGILMSGKALVTREMASGDRIILGQLKPGDLFGEMAAFMPRPVWPATIAAVTGCKAWLIRPEAITGQCHKSCSSHHGLVTNMLRILSEKALDLSQKVNLLSIRGMREKICVFLLEQQARAGGSPLFRLSVNRNEMAEYLGVSRPSMSRELARMRDEGILDFHLSTFKILDAGKLQGHAGSG
ncbi:MAG TPA: transcriptional regulator [Clostridiales bacterium]|nr:transcriptional regulator [Clostridiales bacterium]